MGLQVCAGALLMCTGGVAPAVLNVLPAGRPMCATPAANIADVVPFTNVPPFGACHMLSNPTVAAATAAAAGVLTPMPCVPVPAGTWTPGNPKVVIGEARGHAEHDNACRHQVRSELTADQFAELAS